MSSIFLRSITLATFLCGISNIAYARTITVSAAASLTDVFKEVAASFEKKQPETKVLLNFAASGALLQQLSKGAPVDVVAFADMGTMDRALLQGLVKRNDEKIFARNSLVVVGPTDSSLVIKEWRDLRKPEVKRLAIGNPASVPAGRYAKLALDGANLWDSLAAKFILTANVRQAIDYVARGEVDAGIVYATDAAIFKKRVRVVSDFPKKINKIVKYPLAVVADSRHPLESTGFVNFVISGEGQAILSKYGFKKP